MTLLFENSDFIVVTKPAGMNFHSEEEAGFAVLAKALAGAAELYPVHRLDKMTSGLVLLAKTKAAAQRFGEMFEKHEVEKYYLAVSLRKPKKKQGWIKGDMEKARRGDWKLAKSMDNPLPFRAAARRRTCFPRQALYRQDPPDPCRAQEPGLPHRRGRTVRRQKRGAERGARLPARLRAALRFRRGDVHVRLASGNGRTLPYP